MNEVFMFFIEDDGAEIHLYLAERTETIT